MNNTNRGWIFDQIQSISNDLAIVNHLHEAIYATDKDIEDILTIDDNKENVDTLLVKKQEYIELLKMALTNRRDKMASIKEYAEQYNDRMWCPLKHAIEGYMESMEVWQATFSDKHYIQMTKSMDILSGILSLFLGMELETCGRCLSDYLKTLDI